MSSADRLADIVETVLDQPVRSIRTVRGGYTPNHLAVATLGDATTVFVKAAVDERTAAWLRVEHTVYRALGEATFVPRLLGWHDHPDSPGLVMEDLGHFDWPPPWSEATLRAVVDGLEAVAAARPPADLPRLEEVTEFHTGWAEVAADPAAFLSLRLCTSEWWQRHSDRLAQLSDPELLKGDRLVHCDVRSDNLCVRGGRCVFVDWNWAAVGNPCFDLATWVPSLRVEGAGPPGSARRGPATAALAIMFGGYLAARAGLPPPPGASPELRGLQARQLRIILEEALPVLDMEPPSVAAFSDP